MEKLNNDVHRVDHDHRHDHGHDHGHQHGAQPTSAAKERVLDVAERLFMERGYAAITLRDIAAQLDIKQASLYYHFPAGKEQLFVEVAEHVFARHQRDIGTTIAETPTDIAQQLHAVATRFIQQPPVNLIGMMHADVPALGTASRARVVQGIQRSMFTPLRHLFQNAMQRGEIRAVDPDVITGTFLAIMDGIRFRQTQANAMSPDEMANRVLDILLDGLRPR